MQNPPTYTSTEGNRHSHTPTTTPHERMDHLRQSPVGDADTYDISTTSHVGGGSWAVPILAGAFGLIGLIVVAYLYFVWAR